jgi:ADP-ribose pyrophosphatase YjhB (NUDIX family)
MSRSAPPWPADSAPTLTRDFTATTFVVDQGRTLLLHHRKLGMWLPPGGHIDPHELPDQAALREVREESGLEVQLLESGYMLGQVRVLPQPYCMLLENISPGHQHIDLIYFARVTGGALAPAEREARAARWYTWEELGQPEIAEDIRELGRRAIESYQPASDSTQETEDRG